MRSTRRAAATLSLILFASAVRAGDVEIAGHMFSVPEGFALELAAGPPLVERPITIDFDERGRLYVAESSGTNDPVQKQLAEKPHRILRLVDTDGDGRFDQRTIFADQMMLPEGTMWHEGSLYVAAPPQIWKLTDTDDDGVADKREIWFDGKTLTGCANDLHGPFLGPDGSIYWCKGAFAEQTYLRADGSEFKTRAAHIFRRKANGTGPVEPVMTGGMDNPVDVAFLANGDRIFTTTFLVHPGGGQRDGLIHAIYGGIYGKTHDPIYDPVHKWTSPDVMPTLVHLGPAAPCGLTRYEGAAFGDAYRDNLFACLFNMHKITRHVLTPDGATYAAATEDFLVSPDVDFHPTDVIEDADGSLLVVNTGGWYKLCCPTSQLHKPDVRGAIYRVRRVDAQRADDPRGEKVNWSRSALADLVDFLDDPRPVVRRTAIAQLAKRPLVDTLHDLRRLVASGTRAQRLGIVWAAARIDEPDAHNLLGTLSIDTDPLVRTAARNALGLLSQESLQKVAMHIGRDLGKESTSAFVAKLISDDPDPISRRAGLPLLGRIRAVETVPVLFNALTNRNDRSLDHALTYALIESNDPESVMHGLDHESPHVRRAALVALDQMGAADRIDPSRVASWMTDPDDELRRAVVWVVGRHSEWGEKLGTVLAQQLARRDLTESARAEFTQHVGRIAHSEAVQNLLATLAAGARDNSQAAEAALAAMIASDVSPLPDAWVDSALKLLDDGGRQPAMVKRCLDLLRSRKISDDLAEKIVVKLQAIAGDSSLADELRVAALAALPAQRPQLDSASFAYVLSKLVPDESAAIRSTAAGVLSRTPLSVQQQSALARAVASVGPLELARVLTAFEKSTEEVTGRLLLESLKSAPGAGSLRAEQLKPAFAQQPDSVRRDFEAWLASVRTDEAQQHERVEALLKELPRGDVRRGQAAFNGQKAACVSCHAIGYLGGHIGPDLTRIGSVRTERDLLESIVYPSASFVRSYEPVTLAMRDGRVVNGLVKEENSESIVLTIDAQNVERVSRRDIEEMRPGTVSVMPGGFDQQLTTQELADLIAFLKACR